MIDAYEKESGQKVDREVWRQCMNWRRDFLQVVLEWIDAKKFKFIVDKIKKGEIQFYDACGVQK